MPKKLFFVFSILILVTMACGLPSIPSLSGGNTGNSSQSGSQSGNILFQDDFSNTGSGWDTESTDNGTTGYDNGVYRINVFTPNYDKWGNPSKKFQDDVRIEVDATRTAGPEDIDVGVICRYQDVDNFYQMIITLDGYAGIVKNENGKTSIISSSDGKLQPANGINSGSTLNHIRADCVGSTLTLYANGTKVATATDSTFSGGDIGLIAGNYDTGGADVNFDNLVVYAP